jgi:hypothetical protein
MVGKRRYIGQAEKPQQTLIPKPFDQRHLFPYNARFSELNSRRAHNVCGRKNWWQAVSRCPRPKI